MSLKVLVVPDKFKGTLDAQSVAAAIARGWKQSRLDDTIDLLPMSDGGDGFGDVLNGILRGKIQKTTTVNAAHETINATWWWEPKSKTAIIESAKIIGLAMLPHGAFHPFQLDTFGLGKVIQAAANKGAKKCVIGIGGSATNDGGFGMARALGWKFFNRAGNELTQWTQLNELHAIERPRNWKPMPRIIVAVDVANPLLGARGCSAIYGPQKGLRPKDIPVADRKLKQLNAILRQQLKLDYSKAPGAGAAGGLGFGLMTFVGAECQSGFKIFATNANLQSRVRKANIVITGEGALDQQTLMGKGVGQIAILCKEFQVPCLGIAGIITDPAKAQRRFKMTRALVDIATVDEAKRHPARYIETIAAELAKNCR